MIYIGIIVIAVTTVLDFITSSMAKAKGVHELNPLFRDKDKFFVPMRYIVINAAFIAVVLVIHFTALPDDQKSGTAYAFFVIGSAHAIAAAFNFSKAK